MLLVINQNVQVTSLNLQLLTLIIFQEELFAVDEDISEVGMKLDYFLKSAILETSHEWMHLLSIKFFYDSVLYVLLWFTYQEFHVVASIFLTFTRMCLFYLFSSLKELEVVALFRIFVVLN